MRLLTLLPLLIALPFAACQKDEGPFPKGFPSTADFPSVHAPPSLQAIKGAPEGQTLRFSPTAPSETAIAGTLSTAVSGSDTEEISSQLEGTLHVTPLDASAGFELTSLFRTQLSAGDTPERDLSPSPQGIRQRFLPSGQKDGESAAGDWEEPSWDLSLITHLMQPLFPEAPLAVGSTWERLETLPLMQTQTRLVTHHTLTRFADGQGEIKLALMGGARSEQMQVPEISAVIHLPELRLVGEGTLQFDLQRPDRTAISLDLKLTLVDHSAGVSETHISLTGQLAPTP